MPETLTPELQADVERVQRIPSVPLILDVVCRITGMRFAAVARVTEDHWLACSVKDDLGFGLVAGDELEVQTTICNEIRQHGDAVVIDEVAKSPQYCGHPTPARYGIQSYISMPIVLPDGEFFGTLCAIDPRPARIETPQVVNTFKLFAELIAFHLDATRRLAVSDEALANERETSALREQFIAVLGHDLRNPLNSIVGATAVLDKQKLDAASVPFVKMIQRSVRRMATLIDDVLDFARGRLGSGISIQRNFAPLLPTLEHVVQELRLAHPGREIVTDFDLDGDVDCDHTRIGQLLSNLLANALTYGAPQTAIRVAAGRTGSAVELSVSNTGDAIPARLMTRLFEPFERGAARPSQQGLGLGLYISSEIARAHDGTLTAVSDETETRFTLKISG